VANEAAGHDRLLTIEEYVKLPDTCAFIDESVMIHRPDGSSRLLRGEDVLEGDDVLPGFGLPLAGFFTL
jgi:hypothetical protein